MVRSLLHLLLLLPLCCFGQDFELRPINAAKIKNGMTPPVFDEDIYVYLLQNYKPVSKQYSVKHDTDFDERPLCGFEQKFEGGIEYNVESCGEARGIEVILTLPKTATEPVKDWIEKMYNLEQGGIENAWDKSGMNYGPEDGGAGCNYNIKQYKNKTIITMYCNC